MAVPALVLVSVGAIAAASPAAAHAAPAQQVKSAWACTTTHQRPWMYIAPAGRPWMYAAPAGRPWMYGKINDSVTTQRACQKTARQAAA